jgi:hypothetical protein
MARNLRATTDETLTGGVSLRRHPADVTDTRNAWSHLDGTVRVVETAHPAAGRSTLELWLCQQGEWAVRTVDSRDGLVGPPVRREWDGTAEDTQVPTGHLAKPTSDFDFLVGTWRVRNRWLRERLTGCTDWKEFETTSVVRSHLNGMVNVDEAALPGYRGMTFRTYDVAAAEWSLHWLQSRDLRMDPTPVRGRFDDGAGTFLARDTHAGVPILCRFRWTVPGPDAALWEQAFSTDDGASWETNWTMHHERIG